MKKLVLFFILSAAVLSSVYAQKDTSAPYLRFPTIPPVDLLQLNNTHLTKKELINGQKTLILFFSPSCEHCQHQIRDMLEGMDKLKQIQIVMATYQPQNELEEFYQKYGLATYTNIKIGRDSKFMLPPFYRMKNLPYLALYDEKGGLITTFEGNVSVEKLSQSFEKK
jgi:cytochrome oxidase Cu insertion factor (SCO1/SenC/PrrC family)